MIVTTIVHFVVGMLSVATSTAMPQGLAEGGNIQARAPEAAQLEARNWASVNFGWTHDEDVENKLEARNWASVNFGWTYDDEKKLEARNWASVNFGWTHDADSTDSTA